mmetsp:Transcript_8498/g.32012  ORF Transcript_8498/g.32012 Transcript_8498/m.32012 type:complete len:555 (-) Transcript_8498:293-1957(-)|eukprot:scaffold7613_cov258-Pinguiococcus_pyrenoidosus.AAC.10
MALLLVAKDQVDPQVQVLRDVLALQRFPALPDEVARRLGPRRQLNVVHAIPPLRHAEIKTLGIREEVSVSGVELGNELLQIRRVLQHAIPRPLDADEHAVGRVPPPVLQAKHVLRGRAQQEEEDVAGRRVVRPVQEGRRDAKLSILLWHGLEALLEALQARWVQRADGPTQVAKRVRRRQVQRRAAVVRDDPRIDGVLRQVVRAPVSDGVQVLQVLKIRDAALLPEARQLVQVRLDRRGVARRRLPVPAERERGLRSRPSRRLCALPRDQLVDGIALVAGLEGEEKPRARTAVVLNPRVRVEEELEADMLQDVPPLVQRPDGAQLEGQDRLSGVVQLGGLEVHPCVRDHEAARQLQQRDHPVDGHRVLHEDLFAEVHQMHGIKVQDVPLQIPQQRLQQLVLGADAPLHHDLDDVHDLAHRPAEVVRRRVHQGEQERPVLVLVMRSAARRARHRSHGATAAPPSAGRRRPVGRGRTAGAVSASHVLLKGADAAALLHLDHRVCHEAEELLAVEVAELALRGVHGVVADAAADAAQRKLQQRSLHIRRLEAQAPAA